MCYERVLYPDVIGRAQNETTLGMRNIVIKSVF